jgi:hypothetical protein
VKNEWCFIGEENALAIAELVFDHEKFRYFRPKFQRI